MKIFTCICPPWPQTPELAARWFWKNRIFERPDLPRAGLIALTGHKFPGSITACRRRMREVGLLEGRAA
ncbi:MAG: hypothetical protein LBI92_06735 [Azoarcus sp.]|jgi:hypothetical protein|nr:hypothetical protein [Azoarcus sp.]